MEALILYFVLFFPAVNFPGISGGDGSVSFSITAELGRTLSYTIPSLALIWYLVIGKGEFRSLGPRNLRKVDFISFAIGFAGLAIIGLGVGFSLSFFSRYCDFIPPPRVEAPLDTPGWVVVVFSCLLTGYLEESYFRYYLLTRLRKDWASPVIQIIFATFLFSVCHIYEGPWGITNAALAGILLSLLFIRTGSLHGIAWAHGAYNIFVYAAGISR
jgi:membrane protease YdiL (CAAX protease family)